MKARSIRFALAALTFAASVPAYAQVYVGGSVGRSDISVDRTKLSDPFLDLGFDSASTTSSDNDTAYRAYVGYLFLPYVGVEAGYVDLGKFRFRTDVMPTGSLTGEPRIKGGDLSIVGRLPIGESFAVYGRAGVFAARTNTTYSSDGSVILVDGGERQRKRTTNAAYALGASYDFTRNIGIRAEWARYTDLGNDLTGGRTDANFVSVGLTYTF
jgi:OmpA-OmpF porin, OOP family